ncbi:MAG TPA: hypothetical protein VK469_13170 [Candidatus Kapabacteria bacterium]|nr:hypothetical protein [Candidatus Kapabacteria bacterium]
MKTADVKHINRIVNDIQLLDQYARLEILKKLVHLIKISESLETKKERSLLDLKGLGKEIWETIDSDTYLEQERNSWT